MLDGFTITGGNAGSLNGAGIISDGGSARFVDCSIVSNFATFGGGLYVLGGMPTLLHCNVSGNFASNDGGGIAVAGNEGLVLDNCDISGNEATDSGGGVHVDAGPTDVKLINTCAVSENQARYGGGIFIEEGGVVLIDDCSIVENTATNIVGNAWGGGIFCRSDDLTVSASHFLGNSAGSGGGGLYTVNNPLISNCTFEENSALGFGFSSGGGGVRVAQISSAQLVNCFFVGNISNSKGGAIFNDRSTDATIINCLFTNNAALGQGGAIYNYNTASPDVINCTLSDNTAATAGGVFSDVSTQLTIDNTILWGNVGGSTAIEAQISGPAVVRHSDIQDDDPDDLNVPFGSLRARAVTS